jgi:hypothetical protein
MDDMARFFSGSIAASSMLHSSPFPPLQPQLVILKHKTHSEEMLSKNGIQRLVHIVVKNSPFHLQLGVTNSNKCRVDFNQIAFEAFLLYDCDDLKEVDFVKVKPMEFKATPSENGQQLQVELRIKVLTSQHEDMLFRVKVQGFHPLTREELPGISVITPPIKVISKPEQLKKKQPSKKRTVSDMLVEAMVRIEKKQEEQQQLLDKMMKQQIDHLNFTVEKKQKTDHELTLWEMVPDPSSREYEKESKKEEKALDFEEAFANLMSSYSAMPAEERPETIRKVIRNSSTRDTERLSELLDLFWTEGLQREPSFGGKQNTRDRLAVMGREEGCSCTDCPHKQELERIDEFYKEFLSTGVAAVPGL